VILIMLILFLVLLLKFRKVNIYISGNTILTDEEILSMINYRESSTIDKLSINIKNKLEKNIYILKVSVNKKKLFGEIFIEIEENRPLYIYNEETILFSSEKTNDNFVIPKVTNTIPNDMYDKFFNKIKNIDSIILTRISEIKYSPNEVDDKRFLLAMNDGNYVYLTLNNFEKINNYLDIISNFDGQKGILYLDTGNYFELKK